MCKAQRDLETMTCTEVKDVFIKNFTKETGMSYCEMVKRRETSAADEVGIGVGIGVGEDKSITVDVANIFLSFAFSDNFMEVIRCLQYSLESKGGNRVQPTFI